MPTSDNDIGDGPYVNLFAFPDEAYKNETDLLGIPLAVCGLSSSPIKLNSLSYDEDTNSDISACATLQTENALGIYFIIDGLSSTPNYRCTVNLYRSNGCTGRADIQLSPDSSDTYLSAIDRRTQGPWNSALLKCLPPREQE